MHVPARAAVFLLAVAGATTTQPVGVAPSAFRVATIDQANTYQCRNDETSDLSYTVTVEQTVTTPDSVDEGGAVPVAVQALVMTFDDAGATTLRRGGATVVAGSSSSYEFGYEADQGVLTIGNNSLTIASQPLPPVGGAKLVATDTVGSAPVTGTRIVLVSPSQFDLDLVLSGGTGGTPVITCSIDVTPPLATIEVSSPAEPPSSGGRWVVGAALLGGLAVLVGAGVVVRTRRAAR